MLLLVAALSAVVAHPSEIDPQALQALIAKAKTTHSDALVVMQNGKIVLDENFGKVAAPIEAMSATKSVVNIAVGLLVDEGKLNLETPVSKFFPEYTGGGKEKVTVQTILEHLVAIFRETAVPCWTEIPTHRGFFSGLDVTMATKAEPLIDKLFATGNEYGKAMLEAMGDQGPVWWAFVRDNKLAPGEKSSTRAISLPIRRTVTLANFSLLFRARRSLRQGCARHRRERLCLPMTGLPSVRTFAICRLSSG